MKRFAVLWAWAAHFAGAALAQTPPPVTQPVWEIAPPLGRLSSAPTEYWSNVDLRCRVAGQVLTECAPLLPNVPPAFVESAITAAGEARLAARDGGGRRTEGRYIFVSISFPMPVAAEPPLAQQLTDLITGAVWLERPTGRDYAANYPQRALRERVMARVTLDCLVGEDGRLTCTVLSDDHPEYGFDEATLALARSFRMAAQTRDGAPTAGRRVHVRIRWNIM